MAQRRLVINVDEEGLEALAAEAEVVALVKAFANSYVVVWQAFHPMMSNSVTWDDSYEVYASPTAIEAGAHLQIAAAAPADEGNTYALVDGRFDHGTSDLDPTDIGIRNKDPEFRIGGVQMLTGGRRQTAIVNGQRCPGIVDAQAVGIDQCAITATSEQLLVFAAGGVTAGTVLRSSWLVASNAAPPRLGVTVGTPLLVDLTAVTSRTIAYRGSRFVFA